MRVNSAAVFTIIIRGAAAAADNVDPENFQCAGQKNRPDILPRLIGAFIRNNDIMGNRIFGLRMGQNLIGNDAPLDQRKITGISGGGRGRRRGGGRVLELGTTAVDEGDELVVDFEAGEIQNLSNQKSYRVAKLPSFILEILSDGGLIENLRRRMKK